ncbi:MAG: hypothetical protein ACR2Q4_15825 [Geminicoccaceae bacterium]
MNTCSKLWPFAAITMSLALTACGGGGGAPEELPEITATTTTTVQNQKAQPAHDSKILQLDDVRLKALFTGREINGLSPDGRKWTASFASSGGANIEWNGPGGRGADTGTWKIEGNANCVTWQTLMDGEENCMTVYKVDEDQYNLFNENGSMNGLVTVLDF